MSFSPEKVLLTRLTEAHLSVEMKHDNDLSPLKFEMLNQNGRASPSTWQPRQGSTQLLPLYVKCIGKRPQGITILDIANSKMEPACACNM